MKFRAFVFTALVTGSLGWVGGSVFSEDAPDACDPETMMKLATPGAEHARLAKAFVGEWTTSTTGYMGPEPMTSQGTAKIDTILDGRYLRQEVSGDFGGMKFEGRGLLAFNNGTKKYESVWVDSFGTGLMTGTGAEVEEGKVWAFTSSYDMGKGPIAFRDRIAVVSDKEFTWTMWTGSGEKEKKMMEVTYKRK